MDLEKEIVKLEKYLNKQGRVDLILELRSLGKKDLENRLMRQAVYEQEVLDSKNNDQELQKARETVKALGAPYSENQRMIKKISRFIHLLMEESNKA